MRSIFTDYLVRRRDQIALALMLLLLHFSLALGLENPMSRPLMLAHLGLFLLWQPVWHSDQKLQWYNSLLFVLLTIAFVAWINWWLVAGWLILLTGFVGGRIAVQIGERAVYILVLIFLISELIITCAINLFPVRISVYVVDSFETLHLILPAIMLFLPVSNAVATTAHPVDFINALMVSLLVSLLFLGSLIQVYPFGDADYAVALAYTLIIIGVCLFIISWLATPRAGFSGLAQLWTRSLLNIGTPFERWVARIANLAEQQKQPEDFLEAAMGLLAELPLIDGVAWRSRGSAGTEGAIIGRQISIDYGELEVSIYTRRPLGAALVLHFKLLIQIAENFYVAKIREREIEKRAHLQAIYETGARVTHDIKNLLQSLQALTAVFSDDAVADPSQPIAMLRRQLPHLSQRLESALDKLHAPEPAPAQSARLKSWWQALQGRTNSPNCAYQSDLRGDPLIPADLFDSVVENILENFNSKCLLEPDIRMTISLFADDDRVTLSICDNGSAIQEDRVRSLLKEPLPSDSGLGIGLYQAARQAALLGYALILTHNEPGRVCFELRTAGTEKSLPEATAYNSIEGVPER
jgi:hypothetical protein